MTRRRTILLVEDDCNDVDVALRSIARADLDAVVEVARSGQEALEKLGVDAATEERPDARPLRPAVVFLDLKMPGIDGWAVLDRMRGDPRTASVPVVVVSASDRVEDVDRSYRLGANSFVTKRFDHESPGRHIAEAARYWVELNQPPAFGARRWAR